MKEWNKETFGHTNKRLNSIFLDIQVLENAVEDSALSNTEVIDNICKAEIEKISLMHGRDCLEDQIKTKWIKEGDRNTVSFTRMATTRR